MKTTLRPILLAVALGTTPLAYAAFTAGMVVGVGYGLAGGLLLAGPGIRALAPCTDSIVRRSATPLRSDTPPRYQRAPVASQLGDARCSRSLREVRPLSLPAAHHRTPR